MIFRQYIPVKASGGGGESPDPAVYCPANGYELPPDPAVFCPINGFITDPAAYYEDPVITNAPRPVDGQIRLIVTDLGVRHIYFKCAVSNTGKYVVTVKGNSDVVIYAQTLNNNAYFNYYLPFGEGYLAENYTYYYVDIAPELVTNNLLDFLAPVSTSGEPLGSYILAAYFNATKLTTLINATLNNKRITYIEFLPTMESLSILQAFCQNCSELRKVSFKGGLPELTTLQNAFYGTNYVAVEFPDNLPKLLSMLNIFQLGKIKTFTFPENLPLLANLSGAFKNSEIETVNFPMTVLPELTTLYDIFSGCSKLKGIITYPQSPKLTTIENANYNNENVEEIIYQGSSPLITTIKNTASNCYKLKKITFPESIENITVFSNIQNVVDNCVNLEEVVLPKTLLLPNNTSTPFFNNFVGCYKIHTISKIENTIKGNQYGTITGVNLINLKRFDQPNAFFHNPVGGIAFTPPAGVQGVLEYYDIDWDYFNNTYIDFRRQNMSVAEIRRILSKINLKLRLSPDYFYLSGNPDWMAVAGSWSTCYSIVNNGRTMRFTIVQWDARIQVGFSLVVNQGNGNGNGHLVSIAENNWFQYTAANLVVAPLNGTRMTVYENTFENFGLAPGKTFYVVNSEGDSGRLFQLSETQNGEPFQFSFTASEVGQSIATRPDCHVIDIVFDGTYYNMSMTFPTITNSGARAGRFVDTDYFDFWEFIEKGYQPDITF